MRICQVAKPTIINQIHTKLLADYFTVPRTMPSGDDAVAAMMPSTGRCRYTMPSGDDAVPATMKDKATDNRSDRISTAYEGVLETILQSELARLITIAYYRWRLQETDFSIKL